MANASITTESSILGISDAAEPTVVDSVLALASDRTVANALWFKKTATLISFNYNQNCFSKTSPVVTTSQENYLN